MDVYIPDLIVDGDIVVDFKTVDAITNDHIGQMLNYLRITGLKVGLLVNFKHARLQWRKVILDETND